MLAGVALESIKKTEPPISSSEIENSIQSEIKTDIDQAEQEPIIQREDIDRSAPVTEINAVANTNDSISTSATSIGRALTAEQNA